MIALKFLKTGRVGPFSGFSWPEPGIWVHAEASPDTCRTGIHACRTEDLPFWLAEELWRVELGGEVEIDGHKLVARSGALQEQVAGWTRERGQEYGEACAWRAAEMASNALRGAGHGEASRELNSCDTLEQVLASTRRLAAELPDMRVGLTMTGDGAFRAITGAAPTSAYIAAHVALRVDGPGGYAAERRRQSQWLIDRLGLAQTL